MVDTLSSKIYPDISWDEPSLKQHVFPVGSQLPISADLEDKLRAATSMEQVEQHLTNLVSTVYSEKGNHLKGCLQLF